MRTTTILPVLLAGATSLACAASPAPAPRSAADMSEPSLVPRPVAEVEPEPLADEEVALAPEGTVRTFAVQVTRVEGNIPVRPGDACRLVLEYGTTHPRCLANLDCGERSLVADSFYACELREGYSVGADEMTTEVDDTPSLKLDTRTGLLHLADDAEGRWGVMAMEATIGAVQEHHR